MSVIQEMSHRLWQRYPQVRDPADRDNVTDIVLRRIADHEEKHGPAQNLSALVRRIFPEAVAKVLRKSHYRLRLVPIEDMARFAEMAHATQADVEGDLNAHDFLKVLDKRSRQVVTGTRLSQSVYIVRIAFDCPFTV